MKTIPELLKTNTTQKEDKKFNKWMEKCKDAIDFAATVCFNVNAEFDEDAKTWTITYERACGKRTKMTIKYPKDPFFQSEITDIEDENNKL